MSGPTEAVLKCEGCGATIYPEHLERHTAERWQGKLLCRHCLAEQRPPAAGGVAVVEDSPSGSAAGLRLNRGDGPGAPAADAASRGAEPAGITFDRPQTRAAAFRRALAADSPHATRCRTFHCKLSDAAFGHMNDQVNEWVDSQDDVVIKFATSCIGVVEGKHSDPHLIVTIFY
jgi:hypothetical protein